MLGFPALLMVALVGSGFSLPLLFLLDLSQEAEKRSPVHHFPWAFILPGSGQAVVGPLQHLTYKQIHLPRKPYVYCTNITLYNYTNAHTYTPFTLAK